MLTMGLTNKSYQVKNWAAKRKEGVYTKGVYYWGVLLEEHVVVNFL